MKGQIVLTYDSASMEGAITRAGEFVYSDGSHYKDYNNLVNIFSNLNVLPVIGSRKDDSHLDLDSRLIGFAWNFRPKEDTQQIFADIELFEDIKNLSDLIDPNNLPVSIGFEDTSETEIQNIEKVHHLAVSLNKLERDRCSSAGGLPCTISLKGDFMKSIKEDQEKRASEMSLEECIKNRLAKIKKNHPEMSEEEQRKLATQRCSSRTDAEDKRPPKENLYDELYKSSSSEKRPRKIITQQKVDSMSEQEDITEDLTEDAEATPDNLGSQTHDEAQNTKSARAAFMLDCQKYGPYGESQCAQAWSALQGSPASPKKSGKKDFDEIKEDMDEMKNVIGQLAEIIPTLSEVVQEKSKAKAEDMVKMKEDLKSVDFCPKWVDSIEDFDVLEKFYQGVLGNKTLIKEDTAEEIKQANTSRLLGKRKQEQTDFEEQLAKAKEDGFKRLLKANHPLKVN